MKKQRSSTGTLTNQAARGEKRAAPLPAGIVTFLFTDIEGSTTLWERAPREMGASVAQHHALLRQAIETNGGQVFQIIGDAFQSVFRLATDALQAALAAQRALLAAQWGPTGPLKVRMGLHAGPAELDTLGDAPYQVSHTLNRAARIMSAGHGGQILLSQEVKDLVERSLPQGVHLADLGQHQLKGMQWPEHLYQVDVPDLPTVFPRLATTSQPAHNLPVHLTSFIGREKEIGEVSHILSSNRLITLTGSGGVGKTRLSLKVAEQIQAEISDGIWYIELAPISDPDLVPQIVAATLGLHKDLNRSLIDMLSNFLSSRQSLLVFDNCEHLLGACAHLVDMLLRSSPRLKIIVSSREGLGIAGEITYRVPSLAIPDPRQPPSLAAFKEFEAVRLFIERVHAFLPSFIIDEHTAPAIAQICQRLDGIPLALELAAARLNILTPQQLASRLDNAFRLLTGGSRTAMPRQQTLHATIDWSYRLLNQQEQQLLRRISVFAGGYSLEEAEAICAGEGVASWEVFDLLASLINKSMIVVERLQSEETRYRLLETVRQFARQKLYEADESNTFHDRHLGYYLELAESIEPQLRTSIALERLHLLYREIDNLRAAMSWALEGETYQNIEAGLRLACALLNFWHTQNFHIEGYNWLTKGLSALPEDDSMFDRTRARVCFAIGHLILPIGRSLESQEWLVKSLDIYKKLEDIKGVVMAQSLLGETHAWRDSFDEAKALCKASVTASRTLNDPWLLAWALCRFGLCYKFQGADNLAKPLLEESLSLFKKLEDPLQIGDNFIMLGYIALSQKDYSVSRDYFNQALTSARAMQSNWTMTTALAGLGEVAYHHNMFSEMQEFLQESVFLARKIGHSFLYNALNLQGTAELHLALLNQAAADFFECIQFSNDSKETATSLIGIAGVAFHAGQPEIAARLLGAIQKLGDFTNRNFDEVAVREYELYRSATQNQLDESTFEQTLAKGQAMSLEQAIQYALENKF